MIGGTVEDALLTGLPFSLAFLGVWMTFRLQGEFDLTVDNAFALGGAVFGTWVLAGGNAVVGVALACAAGAAAGVVTFSVMKTLGLSLVLASIIVGTGLFSVNLLVMGQPNLNLFGTSNFMTGWSNTFAGGDLTWGTIEIAALIAVVVFALLALFLKTEFGLLFRASGLNRTMVKSNAGSPAVLLLLAVAAGEALVATSGALVAQQQGFADVQMGLGTLIAAVTAILIGEMVVGGFGATTRGVFAVLVGALVYRAALSLAFRAGLDPVYFQGITAVIVFILLGLRRGGAQLSWRPSSIRLRGPKAPAGSPPARAKKEAA